MYSFKNDYNVLCAKEILDSINKYYDEQNDGYGNDYHSVNARKLIKGLTKEDASVYFLAGGTQTNKVGLLSMLKPYEAIICVSTGHINVHETGAIENNGNKILTTKGKDGKILVSEIEEVLNKHTDCHMVLPKAVYISNSTEIGSVYTKEELEEIYNYCKSRNLYLFIDGARLGVALDSLNGKLTYKDIANNCDMFYIGGTKNGLLLGEALVIINDELKKNFEYLIKNQGAMLAKGFLNGIMFERLFSDNLYLKLAHKANECANYLRNGFKEIGVEVVYPNETNQIFISLDNKIIKELEKEFLFEIWESKNEKSIIRIVTNFQTNIKKCQELLNFIRKTSGITK